MERNGMRKLCLQRSKSRYFFELFFFVVCFHKSSIVARYSLAHKLQFDCHMALACLAFSFSEEKRKFLKNMCQTQIGSIENFFLFLFWFICELGWKLRMGVWKKIRDSLDLTTVGNGRHIYESLWLTKIDMATVHTTHTLTETTKLSNNEFISPQNVSVIALPLQQYQLLLSVYFVVVSVGWFGLSMKRFHCCVLCEDLVVYASISTLF